MKYGSICSGVEAASLAWEGLGWQATFFAEVEPFPAAVLMHRFGATKPLRPLDPADATDEKDRKQRLSWQKQIAELPDGGTIKNLGDFTRIKRSDYEGQIDLIVGGTPCQDLSIAGKRLGFEGSRSVLALDFVRICRETGTRWVVWENVPATLSSHNGEDFAKFLSLLAGWDIPVPTGGWRKSGIITPAEGYFGLAYRILDAQYTRVSKFPRAVPQRRKRLFVIGYIGDWKNPCKVLFEREMCGRNSPPCRTKGQNLAGNTESSIDSANTIRIRCGKPGGGKGALIGDNLSHTLATGNDQTLVAFAKAENEAKWWNGGDKADTLTCTSDRQLMPDKGRLQCVVEPGNGDVPCLDMRQIEVHAEGVAPTLIATDYKGGKAVCEDVCPTIDASYPGKMNNQDVGKLVCYENHPQDSRLKEVEVAQAITARMGTGGGNLPVVMERKSYVVGFIKNDAGGELQNYWREIFPTIRATVTPAIVFQECFNLTTCDANGTRKDRPNGGLYVTEAEASKTVTAGGPNTETVVIAIDGDKIKPKERAGGSGMGVSEEGVMYTQTAGDVHAVAYEQCVVDMMGGKAGCHIHSEDVSPTLTSGRGSAADIHSIAYPTPAEDSVGVDVYNHTATGDAAATITSATGTGNGSGPKVLMEATVRRLLPVECERLMGFPDDHTKIPWKGKSAEDCPDAPRYKACGNSMAVNCMMWIGERIQMVEDEIKGANKSERNTD
ncbi:MAG: DNA cytosine methyltransferase [Lentisphaeria bacterium]|nr:DNA cytosine methyltransferase [Lentisphaeria bacterium]